MESTSLFAVGSLMIILIGLIGIAAFGLWLWSLIHCVSNKNLSDTNRIIGILLILFLGIFGSFIYLFLPREMS